MLHICFIIDLIMSGKRAGPSDCDDDKKHAPIPRNLSHQSITLHFKNTTWEQIGREELWYNPIHQNPYYMFDVPMKNQFNRFKELWSTAEFHEVKYKMSNFIMLHDDYRINAGSPVDTSTFVQVCYLLEHMPKRQTEYFTLCDIENAETMEGDPMTYNLKPTSPLSQLVQIKGFKRFDTLGILPAKINKYAGFDPNSKAEIEPLTFKIKDPYFKPTDPIFSAYSGNLNVPMKDNYIIDGDSITYARNLDSTIPIKYGDVVSHKIVTNLDNVKLHNIAYNDFTTRDDYLNIQEETGSKLSYVGEFCYPSPNRPYLTRASNFNKITPLLHPKSLPNLEHRFYCMPPIEKSNGNLLGQRVSFMLEQEMTITLNFIESIFDEEDSQTFLSQKKTVILRPNLHTAMTASTKDRSVTGAFCKVEKNIKCESVYTKESGAMTTCPLNNFPSLNTFLGEITEIELADIIKVQNTPGSATVLYTCEEQLNADTWGFEGGSFFNEWVKRVDTDEFLVVKVKNPIIDSAAGVGYRPIKFGTGDTINEPYYKVTTNNNNELFLFIDFDKFGAIKTKYKISCVDKPKMDVKKKNNKKRIVEQKVGPNEADFVSDTTQSNIFFV